MMPSVVEAAVAEILGHTSLRPGQREAIDAAVSGDTLAVLSTGTGKSLVYRVAGALRGGLSVVVCPTLSLQMDQLAALRQAGRPAVVINSDQRRPARSAALGSISRGEAGFVLLAPEQLTSADVLEALGAAGVGLFVVDEAHCVVAWGNDFRPEYLHLGAVARDLGRPPVLALTATASPRVRSQIAAGLGMRDPAIIVGDVDRPEIRLAARVVADEAAVDDAVEAALRDAGHGRMREPDRAIVYTQTRAHAERLSARLSEAQMSPSLYHGGLRRSDRQGVHAGFRTGTARLIVGTNAFGLGVDRPDVRLVLHAGPPGDVDSYYQEAGRAGRDGAASSAVLIAHPGGFGVRRYFASGAGPSESLLRAVLESVADQPLRPGELAAATGASAARVRAAVNGLLAVAAVRETPVGIRACAPPGETEAAVDAARAAHAARVAQQRSAVDLVRRYAETSGCRRRLILELLGEDVREPCGNCDNCDEGGGVQLPDGPFPLGSTVIHREWGAGTVEVYEADRVTVLFPTLGHKTISLELADRDGLLRAEPATTGARAAGPRT